MPFRNQIGLDHIPEGANIIQREAVRGVAVQDDHSLLMILTAKGDYKFPGGGVKNGENHAAALKREVLEETGYAIADDLQLLGEVIEMKHDDADPNGCFVMKSHYYSCRIIGEKQDQNLDPYEMALDFKAVFPLIEDAYNRNRHLIENDFADINPWVARELYVLTILMQHISDAQGLIRSTAQ